jgi:hypothetical protein
MLLRTCTTFLFIVFSYIVSAQVQVVVFAGPQISSARYIIKDEKQATGFKTGIHGGAALKVPFDNNLYFFPALYYSLKGYTVDFNQHASPPSLQALNNNTTLHTIEIAPLFQVDLSRKASHAFIRFGPSIDIAISGHEQFDTAKAAPPVSRPMVFSFADYGQITASLNLQLGYEVSRGLVISANLLNGVGNLNNADKGPRILHRVYGLSVGWMFGHNPNVLDTRVRE